MGTSQERRPCRESNATWTGPLSEAMPALPGSKSRSRAKGSRRNLGDPAFGQGNPASGPHREGKPIADDERTREVGPSSSSCEAGEQAERSAAEPVEPRAGTKGNANQQHTVGRGAGKPCHRCWRAYVKPQNSDLPSLTRGRSRMRESRTYGSVRGAGSNLRPYRDRQQHPPGKAAIWG